MPKASVNGIELYYEIHGSGPPLVMIAGVGRELSFWQDILPALSLKYRTVIFDNRGIGRSGMPDIPYSVEMLAADAFALIDTLQLERPHILGHSLGGAVAFEIGRSRPQRVGKVSMLSALYPGPAAVIPSDKAMQVLRNRGGALYELLERGLNIATAPGFAKRQARRFKTLMEEMLRRNQPPHFYLRQVEAGLAYLQSDKLNAPFIPPLCLIYGAEDQVTPPQNGKLIQAKIPGAQLHLLPAAGHLLLPEQPDAAAQAILDFLA